jgi:hypothetical protein
MHPRSAAMETRQVSCRESVALIPPVCNLLAAYLPPMRATLEGVMEQRARSNAQKSVAG